MVDAVALYFMPFKSFFQRGRDVKLHLERYLDIADEIQSKVIANWESYSKIENVFEYLYNYILDDFKVRKAGQRRFINVFLFYMYFEGDIGLR